MDIFSTLRANFSKVVKKSTKNRFWINHVCFDLQSFHATLMQDEASASHTATLVLLDTT